MVADADHIATVVDADDTEIAEQEQTASARRGSVNPGAGRRLRSQMVMAGFVRVEVEPEPLIITDRTSWSTIEPSRVEDVLAALVADRQVSAERASAHLLDLAEREQEGRFLAVLPGYSVIGDKPSPSHREKAVSQQSGGLTPYQRVRLVAAKAERDDAADAYEEAVAAALRDGASVREVSSFTGLAMQTVSDWGRARGGPNTELEARGDAPQVVDPDA